MLRAAEVKKSDDRCERLFREPRVCAGTPHEPEGGTRKCVRHMQKERRRCYSY